MRLKLMNCCILGMLIISSCKKQDDIFEPPTLVEGSKNQSTDMTVSALGDANMKIVAYFPSYRDPAGVSESKYQLITHLHYAFISPNADGSLQALPNPATFNSVIATARANGVKVGISVAGAANLKLACANSGTRTTLVNNLVNFVLTNNLDGLDMDWEFPRTTDGTDLTYSSLMQQLSTALHAQNKYLSAALTAGVYAGSVRDAIRTEVFGYADFFNIMSYDGLGWDTAQPNQHSSYNMAVASLDYWATTRAMPKEKVILGLPAYGRSNATSASATFKDLVAAGANTSADYFTLNGFQYGYNGTTTITSKSNLAKTRGNGVMLWELFQDTNGPVSLLQSAKTALGIGNNPVGIFDDFEAGVGRYTRAPTYSGTTVGIATTSALTRPSGSAHGGSYQLRATLNDNTGVTTPWKVRLLSGDGLPANNVASAKNGTLYFWLKTSTARPGATARIWIDDSDGALQSPAIAIINDGAWHKYAWNLNAFNGTPVSTGNNVVDAINVTLDAIILEQVNTSVQWTVNIDDVGN
ncbi:glycosyl hydrolase family 18 protein [Daejeonella sp.]|uniref:glycosyl hydrolase family 18 protein n=1 Tax=Daejeonella sp. TaxID=2805397 RepID=UPI0030BAD756